MKKQHPKNTQLKKKKVIKWFLEDNRVLFSRRKHVGDSIVNKQYTCQNMGKAPQNSGTVPSASYMYHGMFKFRYAKKMVPD